MKSNKIRLLREFIDFTCESCHHTELELTINNKGSMIKLQPHRIKRGGEYSLRNITMLCPDCHKLFHHKESF